MHQQKNWGLWPLGKSYGQKNYRNVSHKRVSLHKPGMNENNIIS